jgi:hypothetical protein
MNNEELINAGREHALNQLTSMIEALYSTDTFHGQVLARQLIAIKRNQDHALLRLEGFLLGLYEADALAREHFDNVSGVIISGRAQGWW